MTNNTLKVVEQPVEMGADPLQTLLQNGAKQLISQAVEAELEKLLEQYSSVCLADGRKAVVRNGYLPERTIQTGIGDVSIKIPKVRDRSGSGIKFNSELLPPYLKRAKSVEALLPWLYLKGISTGDYQEALSALLGPNAKGLSSNTICRLKEKWVQEHKQWSQRDLSSKQYVYIWADGIYSKVRLDNKLCLLVIIGVTPHGTKELVAVEDGFRESEASWYELLQGLKPRGLVTAPKLAIGDGALGFWNALSKCYQDTAHQRCWVHKTANVLKYLPKSVQAKVKSTLQNIWMAETKSNTYAAFNETINRFSDKYPKAMDCLMKDKEEMLEFYNFPASHWQHIRTTNPIESTFATVRLRSKRARNCGSRETTLSMVFKLLEVAQKKWRKIRGFKMLELVVNNVQFKDGVELKKENHRVAA